MPGLDAASTLLHADDWLFDTGYSLFEKGKIRFSARTLMPDNSAPFPVQ